MARRYITHSIASIFAALLLLGPASSVLAQDTPSAAVVPFGGRRSRPVRRAVARALDDRADLTSERRTNRAADRHGVSGTDAEGTVEMAQSLGVDLLVQGRVSGPRRAQRVQLVIRSADGAELATEELRYRRGRRARRRFSRSVQSLLEQALAARPAAPVEQIEDEEDPIAEAEEIEIEEEIEAPDDGASHPAWLTVAVGLTPRNRSVFIDLAGSTGLRRYDAFYTELGGMVEARPLADADHLGRGLYLNAEIYHSVGLASETMAGTVVDTNFLRIAGTVGWLAPLAEILELGVGVGFGYGGYNLSSNTVLPSAEYIYLRPAVRGRVLAMGETLVIDVEAAYRAPFGTGELATTFGESVEVHGVDVGIGVSGDLKDVAGLGFYWGARFDWVGYFMGFSGMATTPAESGEETSFRLNLRAGWAFR